MIYLENKLVETIDLFAGSVGITVLALEAEIIIYRCKVITLASVLETMFYPNVE